MSPKGILSIDELQYVLFQPRKNGVQRDVQQVDGKWHLYVSVESHAAGGSCMQSLSNCIQ